MDQIQTLWGREPAMVLALVQAIIALGLAFGWNLTDEQFGAVITLVAVALGVLTRSQVTPTSTLPVPPPVPPVVGD